MPSPTIAAQAGTPYGEFLAEQEEIQRLKWLASESEGHDIGFESVTPPKNEMGLHHAEMGQR